ncbi:hypothetical protein ACFU9Y_37910 [Streptomyces sp. NPDC057621]|uniref:Uncharacterized protein n=1 Tax=Streptomyces liliiviolaceus TaxID=2823109 RepID=A0A941B828_9ACTN|nr:hypothetical protein [Streptomyces liliiviolaceus]MBQ0850437.1 hypothetical protein [Streptomyces liliiviolaceus]
MERATSVAWWSRDRNSERSEQCAIAAGAVLQSGHDVLMRDPRADCTDLVQMSTVLVAEVESERLQVLLPH